MSLVCPACLSRSTAKSVEVYTGRGLAVLVCRNSANDDGLGCQSIFSADDLVKWCAGEGHLYGLGVVREVGRVARWMKRLPLSRPATADGLNRPRPALGSDHPRYVAWADREPQRLLAPTHGQEREARRERVTLRREVTGREYRSRFVTRAFSKKKVA